MKIAKNLIALLGILLIGMAEEQASGQIRTKDYYIYTFTADTSTNTDTITFTTPEVILGLYYYSWQIVADSLTGSTAGTAQLQECNDKVGTSYTNLTGKTMTANGIQTMTILTGTVYGCLQRLRVIGSGTQTTQYSVYLTLKRIT